ncbi:MCE family protein [Rhodococcus tukisamuensis]|uniref:Phospholipid/cholesterol/gamma-HCH transport system substrate-binding protein n=1 Tax=Rhodococcus tukisamuensis TaxID=168276 RepID=A0A1G6RB08_9NOCA|nr:MCE family protein [Rhodococcus tukisamuensis]SDD01623.1 phospholipid/cholesterol/gamma-HCH transport system substrate-binding protein [Rhodococcus tukisamuensis]
MRRHRYKLAALALVGAAVGVVALAVALFNQAFTDRVPVTVVAERAGLVMDPGARVKMAGVTVGTVESITPTDELTARLSLLVDPGALEAIPENVEVVITSNTAFGAKFVSLSAPADPSPARLTPGATIDASHVTVEMNTVFENLTSVLRTVEPGKLDATLGAISTALQGRGELLGETVDKADRSLAEFAAARGALDRVLTSLPPVTGTYAEAAPDLMASLGSLTTTGTTVLDGRQSLDLLLLNVTGLANTGAEVLGANSDAAADVLSLLRPTTALVAEYSPVIPCMFHGLQESKKIGDGAYNGQPGIKMSIGLIAGTEPYRYPDDLPKVAATGGPHCMGLPLRDPNVNAPFLVTDTGVNPFASQRQPNGGQPATTVPNLLSYLFGTEVR